MLSRSARGPSCACTSPIQLSVELCGRSRALYVGPRVSHSRKSRSSEKKAATCGRNPATMLVAAWPNYSRDLYFYSADSAECHAKIRQTARQYFLVTPPVSAVTQRTPRSSSRRSAKACFACFHFMLCYDSCPNSMAVAAGSCFPEFPALTLGLSHLTAPAPPRRVQLALPPRLVHSLDPARAFVKVFSFSPFSAPKWRKCLVFSVVRNLHRPASPPQPDVGRCTSLWTTQAGLLHRSCEETACPHPVFAERHRQPIGPGGTPQSTACLGQTIS